MVNVANRADMTQRTCPYLMTTTLTGERRAPIDYPSFENNCAAAAPNHSLLLADQATFCLSGSCHICERYQRASVQEELGEEQPWARKQGTAVNAYDYIDARQVEPHTPSPPQFQDPWASQKTATEDFTPVDLTPNSEMEPAPPVWTGFHRWYSWLAAGLLFFAVITVGGVFAAYMGWQLALDRLVTARAGEIDTLSMAPVSQTQPQFIVMTATNEPEAQITLPAAPLAVAPRSALEEKNPASDGTTTDVQQQTQYPPAVTATPVIVVPLPNTGVENPEQAAGTQPIEQLPQPTATLASVELPAAENTPTPVPIINVQVEVPTRRPTPVYDIPTSTPEPLLPTATETPLPILGTPVVVFAADDQSVPPGECTHVRWHVENVRAVYYESLPSFGDGSKEECLKDEADSYALTVTFADGQTKIYTTSVEILWPTATPSLTPTFTPEILPTETWTPVPPTATPTPNVVYGTTLGINGENPYRCSAGNECNIGVLATNTGDSLDTLAIELLAVGNWPAILCSQIGTCSNQRLVIANVGPQNTVYTTLQLSIPTDSVGQRTTYALRATSEGSGGSVTSQVIELQIDIIE